MNKFLENNKIDDNTILLDLTEGTERIIFKYPNEKQIIEIKNIISENLKLNHELSKEAKSKLYRYIMVNLCNMNNIEDYTDEELYNILSSGKNAKKLMHTMKDLIDELETDYLYEIKENVYDVNKFLNILNNTVGVKEMINKLDKLSKKKKLGMNFEKVKESIIKEDPTILTKEINKMIKNINKVK